MASPAVEGVSPTRPNDLQSLFLRSVKRSGHCFPRRLLGSVGMANVLNEEKKQQVLALGRLGSSPRRRFLVSAGMRSGAGGGANQTGQRSDHRPGAARPAILVIPDPLDPNCNPNPENLSPKGKATATSKPAISNNVAPCQALFKRSPACTLGSAPFRSR
jgi:hypothetical protein